MRRKSVGLAGSLALLLIVVFGVVPAFADVAPEVSFPNTSENVGTITETSAKLKGTVNPKTGPTTTTWEFQSSTAGQGGPFTLIPGATGVLAADNTNHTVEGNMSGLSPDTKYWVRLVAKNEAGAKVSTSQVNEFETLGAPRVSTFSVHAYNEGKIRVMGSIEPQGFSNQVRFQFGKTISYNDPNSPTPVISIPAGSGFGQTRIVGANLTGLEPGALYHYRITTTSTSSGSPTVNGPDRTLVVPLPGPSGSPACANEAFRTGASARLPDCRAYEQVTPENKGAAQDIYGYAALESSGGAGEDGNHFFVRTPSKWGDSPDPAATYYVFDRTAGNVWDMTSATPQPEAGGIHYEPMIFNGDLSKTAIATREEVTLGNPGPESLLRLGPVGGPYVTAANLEFKEEGFGEGGNAWTGASQDFSKTFLETHDHTLAGTPTGTTGSNHDLYEYSGGVFRQVNKIGGVSIGTCGAKLVKGFQTYQSSYQTSAGPHAVSPDGNKFLFIAIPSGACNFFSSENTKIYLSNNTVVEEIAGTGTTFLGANEDLTKVLLQKGANVVLYDTVAKTNTTVAENIFIAENSTEPSVSLDLSAVYFKTGQRLGSEAPSISQDTQTEGEYGSSFGGARNLYRLDVNAKATEFITQTGPPGPRPNLQEGGGYSVSRDGEQFYWAALSPTGGLPAGKQKTTQVYRYDNGEKAIECIGCSSPYNYSPQMQNNFIPAGTPASFLGLELQNGLPNIQIASDDGNYVFFNSPSQLVSQDVNGEVKPQPGEEGDYNTSTSSDVYEWRRNGVNGCTEMQGCLRLISSGRGGSRVMVLGTTRTGNDVFFATHEKLVAQDTDDLGDVYTAHVNGGYPPPSAPPSGCEGVSCQNPVSPPVDTTPGSMTTHRIGNVNQTRANKKKKCKKGFVKKKGKCVKKKGKKQSKRHGGNR